MALKQSKEDIIELGSDPAFDATYEITAYSRWLDTSVTPSLLKERNAANTGWNLVGAASSGSLGRVQEEFTATAGQTTYATTYTPASITDVLILINGWPQSNSNIVSLVGKTFTFTAMEVGWKVAIMYTRID